MAIKKAALPYGGIVFPPDFTMMKAGLVTGSNVSGFSLQDWWTFTHICRKKKETAAP